MNISVIIPTCNSEKTIGDCFRSLNSQTFPPYEIIVVDGGSADSTIDKVKEFKDVKLILSTHLNTPGSARNRGAEYTVGDIIYFCDSDCIADQKALEYHLKAYKSREDISGVMGGIRSAVPRTPVSEFVQKHIIANSWLGNLNQDGTIISHFCSANFTIKRADFLLEKFRNDLVSAEDGELFLRLTKNGLKIFYEPRAVVYHHHPTTVEQLFRQQMWYGEGIFQVYRIHGNNFRTKWRLFSPARYITSNEEDLYKTVFQNNKNLCNGCEFDSFQNCHIQDTQLIKNFIISDVNLHRLTCLAMAAGILKQRTGNDYKLTFGERGEWE